MNKLYQEKTSCEHLKPHHSRCSHRLYILIW